MPWTVSLNEQEPQLRGKKNMEPEEPGILCSWCCSPACSHAAMLCWSLWHEQHGQAAPTSAQ